MASEYDPTTPATVRLQSGTSETFEFETLLKALEFARQKVESRRYTTVVLKVRGSDKEYWGRYLHDLAAQYGIFIEIFT